MTCFYTVSSSPTGMHEKKFLTRVYSFLSLSKLTVYYLHMFLEFDPVLFTNKPTPAH